LSLPSIQKLQCKLLKQSYRLFAYKRYVQREILFVKNLSVSEIQGA